ncbi:molybdenum cofactor synthesis domain-containing protein [Salinifilum ghardaiensis]
MTRTARVIAASNRAAAGTYADTTGPVIVEWLSERGFDVPAPVVVPDGEPVGQALRSAVDGGVDLVVTTGGTGLNPNDRTPEVTAQLLDRAVPGLAEALRTAGLPHVPTAVLSRGLAGVSGRTLIVNLPGSRGGVRDGLGVLDGVLDHALEQIAGGDHARETGAGEQAGSGERGGGSGSGAHEHGRTGCGQASEERAAGPAQVVRAEVTEEAVDVAALERAVAGAASGAVVAFSGVVRDHDDGRAVHELEYVGHPTASTVIGEVVAEMAGRFPGVRALAAQHRVGVLGIGDVALGCAVAGEHRAEAFAAAAELVDEVKRRLPIWKRQVFDDGAEEWVNCP